ncbi:MAG: hypothetical protein ACI8PZ_005289 [Myxococcota bacterium]
MYLPAQGDERPLTDEAVVVDGFVVWVVVVDCQEVEAVVGGDTLGLVSPALLLQAATPVRSGGCSMALTAVGSDLQDGSLNSTIWSAPR